VSWATVLPHSLLDSHWYVVLSGFVAVNTILYVTLSICKIAPKLYLNDVLKRRGRRSETRSIYPNGFCPPDDYVPAPGSLAALGVPERRVPSAHLDETAPQAPRGAPTGPFRVPHAH
jgi:hypothetical protein